MAPFLAGGPGDMVSVSPERARMNDPRTGPEVRTGVEDDTPDPATGRRTRLLAFAAGLFVGSVAAALWLGS